jgi:hypothetical protein
MDVLVVLTPDVELDADAGDRLTRQLRSELAELDIESIAAAPGGPPPEGAKGADPVTLGAIILAMSASGGVFTSVIEMLKGWLGRHTRQHRISVSIDGDTIELDHASDDQQLLLVETFVRRHSAE